MKIFLFYPQKKIDLCLSGYILIAGKEAFILCMIYIFIHDYPVVLIRAQN